MLRADAPEGTMARRRAAIARRSLVAADVLAALVAPLIIALMANATPRLGSFLTAPLVVFAAKVADLGRRVGEVDAAGGAERGGHRCPHGSVFGGPRVPDDQGPLRPSYPWSRRDR